MSLMSCILMGVSTYSHERNRAFNLQGKLEGWNDPVRCSRVCEMVDVQLKFIDITRNERIQFQIAILMHPLILHS